ncbi:MAG: ATP-binding cassette domain-containing protein [Deltaproteobacteria bacterium]|nr:ATP-binding cassette domain-containing protein [Deltaproteobacteria bacterium]
MIETRELSKLYGSQRAVDNLSFQIRRGEVVGFLGPNGAGKSTTMKILTCFIAPTQGEARVGGYDVFDQPLEARSVLGYLPQRAALYTEMGVVEYLEFTAALRAIPRSRQREKIREVAEICGLKEALHKEIGQLSYGYRQRVGLAQALIHDPPILILDEPTADLDPNESAEVIEYIREIGKSRTIMLSTHDLAEVKTACARVLIINRGKIVADGAPEDLASRSGVVRYLVTIDEKEGLFSGGSYRQAPTGAREVLDACGTVVPGASVKELPSDDRAHVVEVTVSGNKDHRKDFFRLAVDRGWNLLELRRETLQLEDVFRQLTTGDEKRSNGKTSKGKE